MHRRTALLIVLLTGFAATARAQGLTEQMLVDDTPVLFGGFGTSLGIWEDSLFVGASGDSSVIVGAGAVQPYTLVGDFWEAGPRIRASDAQPYDRFGASLAVDGPVMVVEARGADDQADGAGAAYVFRHDGVSWVEEQKLLASDGAASDSLGRCCDIDGSVLIVGAEYCDALGVDSGAAYIFRHDGVGWVQEQKLVPSDGASEDRFGVSVAIRGDVALVGAHYSSATGTESGAAYVFRFDGTTWVEEQRLDPTDPPIFEDRYGRSVALDGTTAVVTAPYDANNGYSSGAAYVYTFDGGSWVLEQKFSGSEVEEGDEFGDAVGLDGDRMVVSSPTDDDFGSNSGAVYLFHRESGVWLEDAKITASDAASPDLFGEDVTLRGDVILVGADFASTTVMFSGAAYAYRIAERQFIRGDSNVDLAIDLADAIHILSYAFLAGPAPCLEASDANGDDAVDVGDAVTLLDHLFGSTSALPAPYPGCGMPPGPSALGCESPATCP